MVGKKTPKAIIPISDHYRIERDRLSWAIAVPRKDGRWEQRYWYPTLEMALNGLLTRFLVPEAAVEGGREVLAAIQRAEATIAAAVASAGIVETFDPNEVPW